MGIAFDGVCNLVWWKGLCVMGQRRELNYMNAMACLLVILIHVLSIGVSSLTPSSWQAAVVYFPWRLASFAVPMFLYTGAVKMAQSFEGAYITPKLYGRYILRRIKKIYIPYVIWNVIYFICLLRIGYVRGAAEEFFSYLLIGNLSSPFYYIVLVMQFYFLMPLWIWMLRRVPAYLALAVGLLVTFCMQRCPQILTLVGVTFSYSDRVFLTYLIFWIIGLYVGKHYDQVVLALKRGGDRPPAEWLWFSVPGWRISSTRSRSTCSI